MPPRPTRPGRGISVAGANGNQERCPNPNRRAFLRYLSLAAATGLVPLQRVRALPNPPRPLRIVVVGAGLAGLCAAYELEQRGHEVVLLEAHRQRIGGRIYTHRFGNGQYGELGAMRIPPQHALPRHYANIFGLALRPFVNANPHAYYFARGQRVRIANENALRARYQLAPHEQALSVAELWSRGVLKTLQALNANERADLRRAIFTTDRVRALDRLTLHALLRDAGLSDEAIELIGVAWAYETDLTTAATEILREEDAARSGEYAEIEGGMDRLPQAFATRLRGPLRLGAEVVGLRQAASGGRASAIFRTHDGRYQNETGDAILCTLPLGVLAGIDVIPELSANKRRAIRQIHYDSATKVLLLAKSRFWELDDGIFGGCTYTDLPTAMTYYPADNARQRSAKVSSGPGVLLASYSWGATAQRLAALPSSERHAVVRRTLGRVHPQLTEPGIVESMTSWSWDHNPYSRGAYCWFLPGQHDSLYRHVIEPEGRLFFAGEHASLSHSWMQGALESGLRAVEQILTLG